MSSGLSGQGGRPQHGAGTVGEQHAQVAVAALGDAAENAVGDGGVCAVKAVDDQALC